VRPPFEIFIFRFSIAFNLINHSGATSKASKMFVEIKQKLCANVPKGTPEQLCRVDYEQMKIK